MIAFSFTPFPDLFTERLHLRQLKAEDAPEIFLLRSDPVVNQYLERPKATHIDEAKEFIDKINGFIETNKSIFWGISWGQHSKLVGTICLWNFSAEENKAEIGYELLPGFHGQGIMQEALAKVLDFGFTTMQFQMIEARTIAANINSIKILERNNFKRDLLLESKIDRSIEGEDVIIFSLKSPVLNWQPSSL